MFRNIVRRQGRTPGVPDQNESPGIETLPDGFQIVDVTVDGIFAGVREPNRPAAPNLVVEVNVKSQPSQRG
jgi:hypothetical protein